MHNVEKNGIQQNLNTWWTLRHIIDPYIAYFKCHLKNINIHIYHQFYAFPLYWFAQTRDIIILFHNKKKIFWLHVKLDIQFFNIFDNQHSSYFLNIHMWWYQKHACSFIHFCLFSTKYHIILKEILWFYMFVNFILLEILFV